MAKEMFSRNGNRQVVENMGTPDTSGQGSPDGLSDDGASRSLGFAALIAVPNQSRAKRPVAEATLVTVMHSTSASGVQEDNNKSPVSGRTVSGFLQSLKGQSGWRRIDCRLPVYEE